MEPKLGGSLPVPVVQELAKQNLATVPPRYVRPDQHQQMILSNSLSSSSQIPVIDMQKLSDEYLMDSELQALHNACQEWGFFQVPTQYNYVQYLIIDQPWVDAAVVEKMKLQVQEFFNLPTEEKRKFGQEEGDIQGYGQAFVVSEEQKLDWADLFYIVTAPTYLRKPHLIPKLPSTFRDAIEEYASQLKILAMKILKLMAKALGMKAEEMETLFAEGMHSMRMNYYPPCPQPELVTGLYPHSDAIGLTILLQVNEVDALQIKKDGFWIPVAPLPNAFIINIGDILEVVTNGTYRSIEHRATVNKEKERISVATFLGANMDGDMGPAQSLITPQTPPKFKRIGVAEFMKGYSLEGTSGEIIPGPYEDLGYTILYEDNAQIII
ncbi:UNVERIFIED_CONTAM: protein SRG1 [Sesamum calycinum]|uniref:Protein SRG1 n=1 Tax=Sesamum calycinum TaxID=2727403 RepID=A0AAW2MCV3_9LAMI